MTPIKSPDIPTPHPPARRTTPWLYCLIAALFFFYEFIQMTMFNALSPSLLQAFKLHASQLGNLSAYYSYAMLISLMPAGLLLDHIATKKLILVAMTVSVIGTLLFSLSTTISMATTARFISGLGGAFAFQSTLRVAADNLPFSRLTLANGLIVTFAMLGGIVAQTPMTWLIELLNWRQVLWIYAGMGVLFLIIITIALPNQPLKQTHRIKSITESNNELIDLLMIKIKSVLFNRHTWLAGLYTSLLNLPVPLLGTTWGSLYLTQTHQFSRITASNVISMIFLGIIIGCPLFGWWSDKIRQRRLPMLLGGTLALITILIIMELTSLTHGHLAILFFCLGLFSSAQVIGYSVATEHNLHARSTASAVMSLLVIGVGAISEPSFGWIIDYHWQGTIIHHLRIYTTDNFNTAILVIPIAFIIGLLAVIFLKDRPRGKLILP